MLETEGIDTIQLNKVNMVSPQPDQALLKHSRFSRTIHKRIQNEIEKEAQRIIKNARVQQIVSNFKDRLKQNAYILPSKQSIFNSFEQGFLHNQGNHEESQYIESGIPVWLPTNIYVLIWDCLTIVISFLSLWLYPFIVSFIDDQVFSILEFIVTLQITLDFLLQFNTAVISQGVIITKRRNIFMYYMQRQGLFDLCLSLLWIIQVLNITTGTPGLREAMTVVVTFINVKRVYFKLDMHWDDLQAKGMLYDGLKLIKLVVFVFFLTHMMACIFHYIAKETHEVLGSSWLTVNNLTDSSPWIRYNVAFYWAAMTITTTGYGDITGQNYVEVIFSSLAMLFSTCIFGYVVSTIVTILNSINADLEQYETQLMIINQYMRQHHVHFQIQSRIRNYLKYYKDGRDQNNINIVNEVIQILPKDLQQELDDDIKIKITSNIHQFKRFHNSIKSLSQILEFCQYTPKELIYQQQQQSQRYLYYITSGEVKIEEKASHFTLQNLHKGQVFGQYQFITGDTPQSTAISVGFTNICRFDRDKFIEVLKMSQYDYQLFLQLKDQVLYGKQLELIGAQCNICNQSQHQNIECPVIQYKPDILFKLKKDLMVTQRRSKFHRGRNSYQTKASWKTTLDAARDVNDYLEHSDSVMLDNPMMSESLLEVDAEPTPQNITSRRAGYYFKTRTKTYVQMKSVRPMNCSQRFLPETVQESSNLSIDDLQSYIQYYPHFNYANIIKELPNKLRLSKKFLQSPYFKRAKDYFVYFTQYISYYKIMNLLKT